MGIGRLRMLLLLLHTPRRFISIVSNLIADEYHRSGLKRKLKYWNTFILRVSMASGNALAFIFRCIYNITELKPPYQHYEKIWVKLRIGLQ